MDLWRPDPGAWLQVSPLRAAVVTRVAQATLGSWLRRHMQEVADARCMAAGDGAQSGGRDLGGPA